MTISQGDAIVAKYSSTKTQKQRKNIMKKISSVIILVLALLASSVYAQDIKGGQALLGKPTPVLTTQAPAVVQTVSATVPQTNRVSAVSKATSRISYSIKSRGYVGNYEIVTLRERGLWGNGCLTQVLVDQKGEIVAILNSSASAGPGIALVQGASFVGGMYLLAEHMRPDKNNVNSNNDNSNGDGSGNSGNGGATINNSNSAEGGNAAALNSNNIRAEGGAGGNATGGSANASANNINQNVNTATATTGGDSTVVGPRIPPGHINNPGRGSHGGRW